MRAILLLVASGLVLLALTAINEWVIGPIFEIAGPAKILDGDTLLIAGEKLRLTGIDAPEGDQICKRDGRDWPCGRDATRTLRRYLGNETVHCRSRARDNFGRSVVTCTKKDGTDINAWMVKEGWAVTDGFTAPYASEQSEAKAGKRGIWSGTFDNPADWRRLHAQPK
ncbi:thermonuclease family protein [Hyphomicrobium sp. CS1GBMeth3]|uniref:thermonuclease family protein n=1 Tax=Hyphomicrobium sp. CS1GBMeth3 TaxID=1892845 RepID=UPI000931602D|nr:thermonuclease family protein [Hyphomicrobium sp. CS1GBMeth3]